MFSSTFLSRLTSHPAPLLPITSNPSLQPPYTDVAQPSPTDTTAALLALTRQEAHLQSHIQYLLDVQSDRLLEGLGADAAPTAKFRSTNEAQDHGSTSRIRKTRKEKPTLQGARREIGKAIEELHGVKREAAGVVSSTLDDVTRELDHISTLQTKRERIEDTIRNLESSARSRELDGLAREEEELGSKIYELETQLYGMRARQRSLRQRLQEGRNREEARISSYKGTLDLLAKEEKEVLVRPPVSSSLIRGVGDGNLEAGGGDGNIEAGGGSRERAGEGESVWDLPAKRRTLAMVAEYYDTQKQELEGRLEGIENEAKALEEGGRVWGEVVREVGRVEGLMEREMMGLAEGSNGNGGESGEWGRGEGMKRVLHAMAKAKARVGEKLRMAEERGWKLLDVCVGAELEALVEGEEVLRGILGVVDGGVDNGVEGNGGTVEEGVGRGQGMDDVRELGGKGRRGWIDDTDDDEPGPELLLSRQEDEIGGLGI
ncbi:MAG: hypothetical protein Q9166_003796 [cf. Caloplaca sp. 2 TL-2023]